MSFIDIGLYSYDFENDYQMPKKCVKIFKKLCKQMDKYLKKEYRIDIKKDVK